MIMTSKLQEKKEKKEKKVRKKGKCHAAIKLQISEILLKYFILSSARNQENAENFVLPKYCNKTIKIIFSFKSQVQVRVQVKPKTWISKVKVQNPKSKAQDQS